MYNTTAKAGWVDYYDVFGSSNVFGNSPEQDANDDRETVMVMLRALGTRLLEHKSED